MAARLTRARDGRRRAGRSDPAAGRYEGHIVGVGTSSGVRVVVGRWSRTPLGAFADVMVEHPGGSRVLLAPRHEAAAVVARAYRFEQVHVVPVLVRTHEPSRTWSVGAGPLDLRLTVGGRTRLGSLLRLVPRPVATSTWLATLVDPVARTLLPGVRTHGTAGGGLQEWYGARDQHAVVHLDGTWEGEPLGALAPVEPAVRFGFSSVPARPCVTRVTTTLAPVRGGVATRPASAH